MLQRGRGLLKLNGSCAVTLVATYFLGDKAGVPCLHNQIGLYRLKAWKCPRHKSQI